MPSIKRMMEWPNNLLNEIFLDYEKPITDIPEGFEKSLEYIFNKMEEKQVKTILYYYRDGYTSGEILNMISLKKYYSQSYIKEIIELGLRKLKRFRYIILVGIEEYESFRNVMDYDIRIAFPDMNTKYCNSLNKFGIYTVKDILKFTEKELLSIRNINMININYIKEELAKHNLYLSEIPKM